MPDLSLAARVSALDPYRITMRSSADTRIAAGTGADWFGPLAPMAPLAPDQVAGRQFDYPPGFNLTTQPRAYEPIGFADLRAIADAYDLMRTINDVTFKYAGTLQGGTAMGVTTATLAAGSDPDTTDTLAVDLSLSPGALLPGTAADADQGATLCLVDSELVTYEQSTLTAQYRYDLGVHGASSGYLRRGFYGTAIASHAAGAPFVRLREGSYFTIGYGAAQIGQTVHVKLLSFNKWGGGRQQLDQVTSHPHTLAAPPISSAGLLPGIIQTPDIALQAATGQVTANVAGPVSIGATLASLITASLATTGQLVQLVYNMQIANPTGSTQTYDWLLFRDATAIDSGSTTVTSGGVSTIVRQLTDVPAAASHIYKIEAQYTGISGSGSTASYVDLSATELKR